MVQEIKMPSAGQTPDEATIVEVHVKVGDTVEKNQTLVTIEAMKMETAITARMSGTVSEILVKEGETVKGGQLILVIK